MAVGWGRGQDKTGFKGRTPDRGGLIRLQQKQVIESDEIVYRAGIFPDERKGELMGPGA